MTAYIIFSSIGVDAGPFNLYSNVDGYINAFAAGVTRAQLLAGYPTSAVPEGTTVVRAKSFGVCTNFLDMPMGVAPTSTTTSSTTIAPTTTTTTTAVPIGVQVTGAQRGNAFCLGGLCTLTNSVINITIYTTDGLLTAGQIIYSDPGLTTPYLTNNFVADTSLAPYTVFAVDINGEISFICDSDGGC